ncbi:MAG TPA: alkaline phosphatase family protein [Candidatus Limnocylindrales bacterium]
MTAPVLAVFLDGLGYDGLADMPFLAGQSTVRRIRTELGYSITCHASMYTGLRPDRHGLWFVWQRDAGRSPFRWLRPFRWLDPVDNLPMRLAATKITRRFVRTTSWFGIPYVVNFPWRDMPQLDVSERRLWPEPHYLATAPTIFDRMRAAGLEFEIVGMERRGPRGLAAFEEAPTEATAAGAGVGGNPPALRYLFAGDIDHVSHAHRRHSDEARDVRRRIDAAIERQFAAARRRDPSTELVVWSDHGHHDVERVDPFETFAAHGVDLRRQLTVVDTNFVRMWIPDERRRREVAARLDAVGIGRVMDEPALAGYRCAMPDDRYGNLIFYLDRPRAFSRTIWGFARGLVSAHGYLPDYPESDGVFISTRGVEDRQLQLADVAPSLAGLLGLSMPAGLDGAAAWD